jgi:sarcosine oxidase subunit gamma
MTAAQKVLTISLPTAANTLTVVGDVHILWLGPQEWLIITPEDQIDTLLGELQSALQGVFSAVTDISGGNTMLEISGSVARELMCKGSTIDFHSNKLPVGGCAQTLFAMTNVTIYPYDHTLGQQFAQRSGYRLIVRRSFADYLGHWLTEAAKEFATINTN